MVTNSVRKFRTVLFYTLDYKLPSPASSKTQILHSHTAPPTCLVKFLHFTEEITKFILLLRIPKTKSSRLSLELDLSPSSLLQKVSSKTFLGTHCYNLFREHSSMCV